MRACSLDTGIPFHAVASGELPCDRAIRRQAARMRECRLQPWCAKCKVEGDRVMTDQVDDIVGTELAPIIEALESGKYKRVRQRSFGRCIRPRWPA